MNLTAYTVILNNYDNLRPPPLPSVRFVCFSDRPRSVPPWETQPFPMLFGEDAHRNCRIPKCLPHLLLDTDFSVYMDGAFRPRIRVEALLGVLGDADIALYEHPGGHVSYHDERNHYQQVHGFIPDHVETTYQRYVAEGLPVTGKFYAGGLVVRRHNAATERFNETWFQEYARGSYNDQFALCYALTKLDLKVATIPGCATMDPVFFAYHLHANSGCSDNPSHEAENSRWGHRVDRIKGLL